MNIPGDNSSLAPTEVERLAIIRYQLLIADQQATQVPPTDSLALGTAQDAVESMLRLVADHRGIHVGSREPLMNLFDKVASDVPNNKAFLGLRAATDSLNNARVAFKHHGNWADPRTIERHVASAHQVVSVLSEQALGTEVESASLMIFARDEQVRDHLIAAQDLQRDGLGDQAMKQLRLAFDRLVRDFEDRKSWHPGRSLFSTRPPHVKLHHAQSPSWKDPVHGAYRWLESLDSWVKMLALGVDMRNFAFFQAHVPAAVYSIDGTAHFGIEDEVDVPDSTFRRCRDFVIRTALAFSEDDFDFDAWAAARS